MSQVKKRHLFTVCSAAIGQTQISMDSKSLLSDLISKYESMNTCYIQNTGTVIKDVFNLDGEQILPNEELSKIHSKSPILVIIFGDPEDIDESKNEVINDTIDSNKEQIKKESSKVDTINNEFLKECNTVKDIIAKSAYGEMNTDNIIESMAQLSKKDSSSSSVSKSKVQRDSSIYLEYMDKQSEGRELLSYSLPRPRPSLKRSSRTSNKSTESDVFASATSLSADNNDSNDNNNDKVPISSSINDGSVPPPPPPPPSNLLASIPPPPPPPPPMLGNTSETDIPKSSKGDFRSQLINTLKDPNIRGRLRKVIPTKNENKPIKNYELSSADKRAEALLTLLGYVELPGGNPDELAEKCQNLSSTVRDLLYVMIRKQWVSATTTSKSFKVWQGRECIRTEKIHSNQTIPKDYLFNTIMFHISKTKGYSLDEIYLVEGKKYPGKFQEFSISKPTIPKDNSLSARKQWDEYERLQVQFEQSDNYQHGLIMQKLEIATNNLRNTSSSLLKSSQEMKGSSERLMKCFDGMNNDDILRIVKNIPKRIEEIRRQVEKDTGVIIRDGDVKLTPDFLANQVKIAFDQIDE